MSKETIKNNGNNILKNENKYFYILISGKKVKILSSSRDNSNSKKDVIEFLNNNIDKFINLSKDKFPYLYKLTIKKINKEDKETAKNSNIISIGGPLKIILEEVKIKLQNKKFSLKINKDIDRSNIIYIDKKYLKKHNFIDEKILKKITSKYYINEIKSFSLNKISHFVNKI